MRTNLYEETIGKLRENGKTAKDVLWVGSTEAFCTWEDFEAIATNTSYDAGYGGQEICPDLLVVGKGWWLERHEYDGSEWWEFKVKPTKPKEQIKPITFKRAGYMNDSFVASQTPEEF